MLPFAAAALIVLRLLAQLVLLALNRAELRRWAGAPPPQAAAIMDGPTYARAVAYTRARLVFAAWSSVFDAAVLGAALLTGLLPGLARWIGTGAGPGALVRGALFLCAAGLALGAAGLPFDAWETFFLEAKFGFNRATPALWAADKAKGLVLSLALGFPLLLALLALVRAAGQAWWLWGFALVFSFQLILLLLYPRLILPWFNRLRPLPEGEARTRLLALAGRVGFRAAAIEVMDAGRRSAHANAFFTGFGRFRRIVLFDTLVAQLSPPELEAVLAHEIGHWRLGHVPRALAGAAAAGAAGFALLGWLARHPAFAAAFGYPPGDRAGTFLLFALLSGPVTFWAAPLARRISRRHEFAADAYARRAMGESAPLIAALRRLADRNLSNLTPHPWYSAFYYSHPTLAEREKALATAAP